MPEPTSATAIEVRHERTESARLDNFVDGVFAFAVTLLIISGGGLPTNVLALEHALRGVPAFAACFAELAWFWHGHVRWRDTARLTDGASLKLSLLLVFFALIFVFPLHLAFSGFFNGISDGVLWPEFPDTNGLRAATALFACFGLSFACMAGTLAWLFRHGLRKGTLSRGDMITIRVSLRVWTFCAAIGLLSTLIALLALAAQSGSLMSLAGFCYVVLAFTGVSAARYRERLEATLP